LQLVVVVAVRPVGPKCLNKVQRMVWYAIMVSGSIYVSLADLYEYMQSYARGLGFTYAYALFCLALK